MQILLPEPGDFVDLAVALDAATELGGGVLFDLIEQLEEDRVGLFRSLGAADALLRPRAVGPGQLFGELLVARFLKHLAKARQEILQVDPDLFVIRVAGDARGHQVARQLPSVRLVDSLESGLAS
ncbi:MAG: hypothetical protein AAF961_18020 [Planctomycetota bacterium]